MLTFYNHKVLKTVATDLSHLGEKTWYKSNEITFDRTHVEHHYNFLSNVHILLNSGLKIINFRNNQTTKCIIYLCNISHVKTHKYLTFDISCCLIDTI